MIRIAVSRPFVSFHVKRAIPFTLFLTCSIGAAMAVETTKNVDAPLRPPSSQEQYLQTQRGQEAQAIMEMGLRGDRDAANRAALQFRQKYGIPLNNMDALKVRRQLQQQNGSDEQYVPPMLPMPGGNN